MKLTTTDGRTYDAPKGTDPYIAKIHLPLCFARENSAVDRFCRGCAAFKPCGDLMVNARELRALTEIANIHAREGW